LPQREPERERRSNLRAGCGGLRLADGLATQLAQAVGDPAGNEAALAREILRRLDAESKAEARPIP